MATPKTARADLELAIGALIREKRKARALNQDELGAVIGVSYQQIQKYERGKNRVAVSTLIAIAAALDCHILNLIPPEALIPAPIAR